MSNPDFDELRRKRDEAINASIDRFCVEEGLDRSQLSFVHLSPNPSQCYCACPDGPCEHQFSGCREFEDGSGGEQVCIKCGMGAMAHSMRFGP